MAGQSNAKHGGLSRIFFPANHPFNWLGSVGQAIHEGVVFSNRDKRILLDKLVIMLSSLGITLPYCLVGDNLLDIDPDRIGYAV